jgi:hypothetical protein
MTGMYVINNMTNARNKRASFFRRIETDYERRHSPGVYRDDDHLCVWKCNSYQVHKKRHKNGNLFPVSSFLDGKTEDYGYRRKGGAI